MTSLLIVVLSWSAAALLLGLALGAGLRRAGVATDPDDRAPAVQRRAAAEYPQPDSESLTTA